MSRLGTVWVAPGEGATLRQLIEFAGANGQRTSVFRLWDLSGAQPDDVLTGAMFDRRTNLRLTGERWQPYDTERLESPSLHVVPANACPICLNNPCDCEGAEVAP